MKSSLLYLFLFQFVYAVDQYADVSTFNFTLIAAGTTQTAELYRQMNLSYANRPDHGVQSVDISYAAIGTPEGIQQVMIDQAIFACDMDKIPDYTAGLVGIPQAIGSILIVYNRESFPDLDFNDHLVFPYDLANKIYSGEITYWNDPYIANVNPNITLPNERIVVVAPNDTTGGLTTAFRRTLHLIDNSWTATGENDLWPLYDYLEADEIGVLSRVILTPYAIGFSGYQHAYTVTAAYASIQNIQGQNVLPTVNAMNAGLNYFLDPSRVSNLYNQEIGYIGGDMVNADAPDAYPYIYVFYGVMKQNATTLCKERREALRFVDWRITSSTGIFVVENAGFAVFPPYFVENIIIPFAKTIYCDGELLYGASPCDNGCVGGTCDVIGIFNPPQDICTCDVAYVNVKYNNCSEPRPGAFIAFDDVAGSTAASLSTIFAVYTLVVMGLIGYYRKLPLVKALSPIFCIITLVGLLFEYAGIYVLIGEPTNSSCSLQMWFVSLPLAVIFAAILVKQYRLVTVFENKARASMGIKNENLLLLVGIIVLPCIILLTLYTTLAKPMATRALNPANEFVWACKASDNTVQAAIFVLLGLYHVFQVAFSIFLALKGKNIRDEYNESRAVGITVYILATVGIITIIILSIPQLPYIARFAVRAAAIILSSFAFTVILFLKPLRTIKEATINDKVNSRKNTENSDMKMVNKGGVIVAVTQSSTSGVSGNSDDEEETAGPVKKIKEDAWKWSVYARPRKFLERWRYCTLTFHKELGTISLIQKSNLNVRAESTLTVCFPLKSIKLIYRGYNVTGGSQGSSVGIMKALTTDKVDEELESLVLEFHVANGESYSVQAKSVKQAEQVVGLFTGSTLKDVETQISSRHATTNRSSAALSGANSKNVPHSSATGEPNSKQMTSSHGQSRSEAKLTSDDGEDERESGGSQGELSMSKSRHSEN